MVTCGTLAAAHRAMGENARIPIDQNGLSKCVRGQLIYEPDLAAVDFPFPRRVSRAGLSAVVVAHLLVESVHTRTFTSLQQRA